MAERKAQNKWIPPDFNPAKHGSANGYHKTHHLRERARKLDQGILIVRFELPFNIWCLGCNNHIGMGVRYNAEKKKIGAYYSTKIFEFRMKCHLCDNHFTIKTDPQNLDYVVESGARRQDKRWNDADNEQIVIGDKEKTDKLASDSMFKLEHLAEDRNKLLKLVPTLERLEDFQDERWRDDFSSNQSLRKIFRKTRNELKLKAKEDQKLLDKCGTDLLIEDEDPNDVRLSKLLKLTSSETADEIQEKKRSDILFDSVGLQQSSVHNYLNKRTYKTAELKNIAKTIVVKNTEQLSRHNLKQSLKSIKKIKTEKNNDRQLIDKSDDSSNNNNSNRSLVANYSGSDSESNND